MYVQVYEEAGFTEYKVSGKNMLEVQALTPYKLKIRKDMISTEIMSELQTDSPIRVSRRFAINQDRPI